MWWAIVLWECPLLQRSMIPDAEKRTRILSRFFGLCVSFHRPPSESTSFLVSCASPLMAMNL
ncbi:hypothetical protein BT69DRAFT_1283215 [Atractiella rhizophila]|nr:hypothetical protein BT69DRAFT_1283215 [Atractiella rhizophila]